MNTLNFLYNYNTLDLVKKARTDLFQLGIKWCDSVNGNYVENSKFRVILFSNKGSAKFDNPMVSECNGTIFEFNITNPVKWRILCVPPKALNPNKISIKKLSDMYKSGMYELYEAYDGSIVNMYFYEGEWRLSSVKGFDITHLQMFEQLSYKDVFMQIVENKYPNFKFEGLNINYCYTFCMRYYPYHIFTENRSNRIANTYMNVIQIVNMNTLCVENKDTINIHNSPMFNLKLMGLFINFPINSKNLSNVNVLMNKCKNALSSYEKAITKNNTVVRPLYGYILRSIHPNIPNEYQNIFFESSLMKVIRNGIYKDNHEHLRNGNYKLLTISLFLNKRYNSVYKTVFQQFTEEFESLNIIVDTLIHAITHYMYTNQHLNLQPVIVQFITDVSNTMTENNVYNKDIVFDDTEKNKIRSLVEDYMFNQKFKNQLINIIMNTDIINLISNH